MSERGLFGSDQRGHGSAFGQLFQRYIPTLPVGHLRLSAVVSLPAHLANSLLVPQVTLLHYHHHIIAGGIFNFSFVLNHRDGAAHIQELILASCILLVTSLSLFSLARQVHLFINNNSQRRIDSIPFEMSSWSRPRVSFIPIGPALKSRGNEQPI